MTSIKLTGQVIDWDDPLTEDAIVDASLEEEYIAAGYSTTEFQGKILAFRPAPPEDGTITIQPKSDMLGRDAQFGGHTNYGYSGYFKGFVYLGGKRKTIVDWWTLFPGDTHHYKAQKEAPAVAASISSRIAAMAGVELVKVKGGYAFDPVAHEARKKAG